MDNRNFDIRALIGLLVRQRRTVALTFVAIMVIATLAIFALKPIYTASALVMVDPSSKNVLEAGVPRGDVSDSSRVDSEVLIAQSIDVLTEVARRLNLTALPEFQPRDGVVQRLMAALKLVEPQVYSSEEQVQSAVAELSQKVSVRRNGVTFVLSINGQSSDPQLAVDIANTTAAAYIDQQVGRKIQSTTASRDVIEARVAEAGIATQRSEEDLGRFVSRQLEIISKQTGNANIANIRDQIGQITSTKDQYSALLDQVTKGVARQDWVSLAQAVPTAQFKVLNERRQQVQGQLIANQSNASKVLSLRVELDQLQTSLAAEANSQANSLSAQISVSQDAAAKLRDQLRASILSADLKPDMLSDLYSLQQTAANARTQYQQLLSRRQDLDTQAFLQVADSTIVGAATIPIAPSFPSTRLFLVVAGVLALTAAVGLALLVDNYIGGFTSAAQLEAVTRTEVISTVPRQKTSKTTREGKESHTVADLVIDAPLSTFAEAIRRIRLGTERAERSIGSNLDGPKLGTVVMVTSATPGEGRTSLSLALSRSYVVAGRQCLLIDCDLRKPSLHSHLGLERATGLMDFINGDSNNVPLQSIVQHDPRNGATVVVGAQPSQVSTDHYVAGKSFAGVIDAARKVFDVVILDTPPIVPVVDTLYLAGFADVIVFVTRWASTSQTDTKDAIRLLDEERRPEVEILTVLNQVEGTDVRGARYMDYYMEPGAA